MQSRLESLLPPSASTDPAKVAGELLSAVLVRSNFIPGVRHRLGWRGVATCMSAPSCSTARVDGRRGVFGLAPADVLQSDATSRTLARLFYFPHPQEDLADAFSVQAGIHVQSDGYLDMVRDFPRYPDFAALFMVGTVDLAFAPDSCDTGPSAALAITAPERHIVLAMDGVTVDTPGGTVQLVTPGGEDQDLPSMDTAMPIFRALAASMAYCLGQAPDSLARWRRNLPRFVYDADGMHGTEDWSGGKELRLALGFNAPAYDLASPDELLPGATPWVYDNAHSWQTPAPVPPEYTDERWWNPDVPGAANSLDKNAMGISDPPRLIVLTGFLGSGKTSFLSNFIEQQAARNAFTAVIQNEIGAKGLDGRLLGQRYAVTEMDEGCVCCSLAGNLRPALAEVLASFQPDFVVLETTGLANPANLLDEIAEIGDQAAFGSVTTVIDAPQAMAQLDAHEVARSQARLADVLLLNKADLVDAETLNAIEVRLRTLNPTAPIHRCAYGDVPVGRLYGVNMRPIRRPHLPLMGMPHDHATHADDGIDSMVVDMHAPIDRDAFLAWVDALPAGILRAKGVLDFKGLDEPQLVQYVPGRLDFSPAGEANDGDRFLVVIGSEVKEAINNVPTR